MRQGASSAVWHRALLRVLICAWLTFLPSACSRRARYIPTPHAPTQRPAPLRSLQVIEQFGGYASDMVVDGDVVYLATGPRLALWDVSDPSNARRLGQTAALSDTVTCMALGAGLAYLGGSFGLRVVDVSTPARPSLVDDDENSDGNWERLVVADQRLYALGGGWLKAFDLSDPEAPREMSRLELLGDLRDVALDGDRLYIQLLYDKTLILDVSQADLLRQVGTLEVPGAQSLVVRGGVAFLAGETGTDDGLAVYDVGDASRPRRLASMKGLRMTRTLALSGSMLIGAGEGFVRIVDISRPDAPKESGSMETGHSISELAVSGDRLLALTGDQLLVYALNKEASAQALADLDLPERVTDIVVDDGKAYLAANDTGLIVVDVAEPTAPRILGSLKTLQPAYSLAVDGATAYLSTREGLEVIDVAEPAVPRRIGSLPFSNDCGCGVVIIDKLAVVAARPGLRVIDVSNPRSPRQVGSLDMPVSARLAANGKHVLAPGSGGLAIIDVGDPTSPTLVGRATLPHESSFKAIEVDEGVAYVTNGSEGLWIGDVSDPRWPRQLASLALPGGTFSLARDQDTLWVGSLPRGDSPFGLQAVDVGDPSRPRFLGGTVVAKGTVAMATAGRQAFVASDMEAGLQLQSVDFEASGTAPASLMVELASVQVGIHASMVRPLGPLSQAVLATDGVGLKVLDDSSLVPIRDIQAASGLPVHDVQVSQGLAFLLTPNQILILGLHSLEDPPEVGAIELGRASTSQDVAYVATDTHVYVVMDGELAVYDVQTQLALGPAVIKRLGAVRFMDEGIGGGPYRLAVGQGLAVLLDYEDTNLIVVDVSKPELPRVRGDMDIKGLGISDVAVNGNRAYLSFVDSWLIGTTGNEYGVKVVDLSNPRKPKELGPIGDGMPEEVTLEAGGGQVILWWSEFEGTCRTRYLTVDAAGATADVTTAPIGGCQRTRPVLHHDPYVPQADRIFVAAGSGGLYVLGAGSQP